MVVYVSSQDGKIDLSELRYFFRTCGQTDVVADLWPKDHAQKG